MSLKLKSRWMNRTQEGSSDGHCEKKKEKKNSSPELEEEVEVGVSHRPFVPIPENEFLVKDEDDKKKKHSRMVCDCSTSPEERLEGKIPCGEDCLNRILLIECGPKCSCGQYCTNKRFQKKAYADVEPFEAGEKGKGLRTQTKIPKHSFVIEYVGEVINASQFRHRTKRYGKDSKHKHHYFMAYRANEVIDATDKGNISRFINHSCEPNCETQKWTVNGDLRIGFFSIKDIEPGEEITFDYQFQRYGREAQKCFCGAEKCRGFIGGEQTSTATATKGKDTEKERRLKEKRRRAMLEDMALDEELNELINAKALRTREQVLSLSRLMVRGVDFEARMKLLKVLEATEEQCLRLFLDYHGCWLIWSWLVDDEDMERTHTLLVQIQLLKILSLLPIPHRNMLEDSRILRVVTRWAHTSPSTVAVELERGVGRVGGEVREVVKRLVDSVCCGLEGDSTPSFSSSSSSVDGDEAVQDESPRHLQLSQSIHDASKQLLHKWGQLREYFKIPKKTEAGKAARAGKVGDRTYQIENHSPLEAASRNVLTKAQAMSYNQHVFGGSEYGNHPGGGGRRESREYGSRGRRRSRSRSRSPHYRRRESRDYRMEREPRGERDFTRHEPRDSRPPSPPPPKSERRRPSRFDRRSPVTFKTTPISKEDRRREFEASVAKDLEAVEQDNMGREFEMSVALVKDEMLQQQIDLLKHESMVISPVHSFDSPSTSAIPLPSFPSTHKPKPMPAVLMWCPITNQYWWQDSASGTLVYIVSPEQYARISAGDWSSAPYFTFNHQTGLIHESTESELAREDSVESSEMEDSTSTLPNISSTTTPISTTLRTELKPEEKIQALEAQLQELREQVERQKQQKAIEEAVIPPPEPPSDIEKEPERPESAMSLDDEVTTSAAPKVENPPEKTEESGTVKLPPLWKAATDEEGNVYYYHTDTRNSQWEVPTEETMEGSGALTPLPVTPPSLVNVSSSSSLSQQPSVKKAPISETTTAAADTSSEVTKKNKEAFKASISKYIMKCIYPFKKPDCKQGRITTSDDFKHVARKLCHAVMEKELKRCNNRYEDLKLTESVRKKAKDYVKNYMKKRGPVYVRTGSLISP